MTTKPWNPAKASETLDAYRELATPRSVYLELPWPPTVNTYWRSVVIGGRARVLISERGRAYRDTVKTAVINQTQRSHRRVEGKVSVDILAMPPDRRKRDLDNLPKSVLDALQEAGVIADDGDVDELRIRRRRVADKPGITVMVTPITDETANGFLR